MIKLQIEPVSDPIDNRYHHLFKQVFRSEEGKEVFDTISDFSCLFLSNILLTPHQSAWVEGRRSLMLDIANITRGVSQQALDEYQRKHEQLKKGVFPWNLPTTQQEQQQNNSPWAMW
ncbi:hypothetical protein [Cysteiniphilum sp. 6C5]|uniref:hypothetical protein n=1 Tax=unclassified Cysteiniphilum TaxID=2610889 RepID=UPI003F83DC21